MGYGKRIEGGLLSYESNKKKRIHEIRGILIGLQGFFQYGDALGTFFHQYLFPGGGRSFPLGRSYSVEIESIKLNLRRGLDTSTINGIDEVDILGCYIILPFLFSLAFIVESTQPIPKVVARFFKGTIKDLIH
jgi:hypothetical protein